MIKPVPEATAGMLLSHTVCELHGAQASLGLVFAPTRRVTCKLSEALRLSAGSFVTV